MQTFIFAHDQNIIIDYERCGKFDCLDDVRYVFLGHGNVDRIAGNEKVTIARDFKDNIERYPKLVSFTGWYLIWRNSLVHADYVNLFEYDININVEKLARSIGTPGLEVIGYVPCQIDNPIVFGDETYSKPLVESIEAVYGIEFASVLQGLEPDKKCSMTSNHTFSRVAFHRYMEWVGPIYERIKEEPMCGHLIERSIPAFYILNKVDFAVYEDVLEHFFMNSHQTYERTIEEDVYRKLL